jgi:uncharacterized protein YdeI (YjbR/CyaY-like superfamily)
MARSETNPQVDVFFRKAKKWREELAKLRGIILGFPLTEELKWGKPCYAFEASNVVILLPLKEYCALLFCKGALLKDTHGMLIKAGENTQAARQIRFTHLREIAGREAALKGYIRQAIEVQKAGLEVSYKTIDEFSVPEEFQKKLDEIPALKSAYGSLSPGRRRAYLMHFSAAKQSKTREARVEKWMPQILKGKGMNN